MGFPRPDYWGELPFPPPGDLTNPGIKPRSPALAGGFFITESPGTSILKIKLIQISALVRISEEFVRGCRKR